MGLALKGELRQETPAARPRAESRIISRSGNNCSIQGQIPAEIPDREISLAPGTLVADNFPNGKLSRP
jgi:hypothetical protein